MNSVWEKNVLFKEDDSKRNCSLQGPVKLVKLKHWNVSESLLQYCTDVEKTYHIPQQKQIESHKPQIAAFTNLLTPLCC